jgi:hypothetical protein
MASPQRFKRVILVSLATLLAIELCLLIISKFTSDDDDSSSLLSIVPHTTAYLSGVASTGKSKWGVGEFAVRQLTKDKESKHAFGAT